MVRVKKCIHTAIVGKEVPIVFIYDAAGQLPGGYEVELDGETYLVLHNELEKIDETEPGPTE